MSNRISLTDREIDYIIEGLTTLKNQTNLDYSVIRTGQQVYHDIINKLRPSAEKASTE